nr:NB-ARC domains-containing protein [Tanacetum cinerariifolium]
MAAALLPIVFEKLASVLENKIARSNEIHSELKKWERSLSLIQAFLEDASQKEVKSKAVKHKLDDISTRLQELMEEKEKLGLSVKNGGSKDKNRCYSEHLRKRGFWKQNYHHNSKERIELRQHGEGIIKKCDGLPLALEALGRLLRNRTDEEEWKRLLDNEIWMLEDEGGILLALRLIYHDLSACLKQLLAYCCLIPKDYVFKKKDLILWWMAEGFLHNSNTNKTMECLGGEYFSRAAVKLEIQELNEVKDVGPEFLGRGIAFPKLECVIIRNMWGWEVWSTKSGVVGAVMFPCLKELYILNYPNLAKVSLEALPSLRVLGVSVCGDGVLTSLIHVASSVTQLGIDNILGLSDEVWRGVMNYLGSVEELIICGCNEIRYLWESEVEASKEEEDGCNQLTSLRILDLKECNNLEQLIIENCDRIESMVELACFVQLTKLRIKDYSSIESFPTADLPNLTSLKHLIVVKCKSMDVDSFGVWPPKLGDLEISHLKKPILNFGRQDFPPSLVHLELLGGSAEEEDDVTGGSQLSNMLPSSLTNLKLGGFKKLESISRGLLLDYGSRMTLIHYEYASYIIIPGELDNQASYDMVNRRIMLLGKQMTTSVGNNSVFRSFFKKQKLIGPNFIDWYRQLRLVLSTEDNENYLEHLIPTTPVAPPGQQVSHQALAAHAAWELKAMYSKQAEQELLQTVREFHTSKQEEGQSVSSHVLKIKGYIDNLERLGQLIGQNLAVSLILVSLNKDFDSFVQNYSTHGMGNTVNELHAMLKLHEETLPKKDANPALHAIRAGRVQKNQKNKPHKAVKGGHGKGKGKMGYALNNAPFAPKPKTPPPPKKDNPAKDAICHQCGKVGHWRRKCPVKSWIYDTGCGTHICITTQGLRGSKKLKPGALSLYMGDGHRAAVEAIGIYHLELPSRLVIVLNNFHYAPSITRGVISVLRLFDDGFINRFDENNVISVSKNNLVYFMAVPRDGIFEIDIKR